ncbi:putative protein kinase RLK-Pelle-CrRLK1L-1 family [Helianthus anomalus]
MKSVTREESTMTSAQQCRRFSLAEIQSATRNFDDELIIGRGGFGTVYKGQISSEEGGQVAAIKRLDSMSNQGESEFRVEIDMLSTLRHCHLVSLIGYCEDNKEKILVYEYMPNSSLYHHLHKGDTHLSWVTRLKLAIGAARGLDYLHTGVGTRHGVIHRDVKSSNILLDESWSAMISDFGLSKIGPTNQLVSSVDASVKGTFGYLDPEYFYTRKLTRKTDVYAFGVVLFELLSGREPVDEQNEEDQCSLVRWAQRCVKERRLDQMVDSNIKGTISTKCLRQFARIAYRCVHPDLKERPTMTEVVGLLQSLLELQEKSNHSTKSSSIMGFPWMFHNYFVHKTKVNSDQSGTSSEMSLENKMNQHEELVIPEDVKMFTYDELKLATKDFGNDTCLGEESYGIVYKGWVDKTTYSPCKDDTGLPVVVKKLHRYKVTNLDMLKEYRHPNLVKLIGCCLENGYLFLVYEFMRKGNFEDLLRSGAVARLPLVTKVKILLGIARGISFLQKPELNQTWPTLCESQLYRHKIMLDEDFTTKLSDYDVTFIVNGQYDKAYPDYDGLELVLNSDLSGYEVLFVEVLTGERLYNSNIVKIDRLFRRYGKESLHHISHLCFAICNEADSEKKMVTMLKEHDKLIRRKLKSWLSDPQN